MPRLFFNLREKSFQQKKEILFKMKEESILIKIDELDCSKSFHRVKSSLEFNDIIQYIKPDSLFSLVSNTEPDWETKTANTELCIRTVKTNNPFTEIFVWVYVENSKAGKIIEDFKLNIMRD